MTITPTVPTVERQPRHSMPVLDGGEAPVTAYLKLSKTWTYSFIFVLPLVLLYEIGIHLVNAGAQMQVRVSADILVKRALGLIGIEGTLMVSAFVVAVGALIVFYERRRHIPIRPRYFAWMFFESLAYGPLVGFGVHWLVTAMPLVQPTMLQIAGRPGFADNLVLSLGAGIYEELVFRLLLVSLVVWVLNRMRWVKWIARLGMRQRYAIVAVIGALIFSSVHYIGSLGDTFELASFTFRFLMGLALNMLMLVRGFGIAAMTHALYDVMVTLLNA